MITSQDHRLVSLPASGLLTGQRVGVARQAMPAGAAVLTTAVAGGSRHTAVQVVPLDEVPSNIFAVGEDLAVELGIAENTAWSLEPRPTVDIARLVLEMTTERKPDEVAAEIAAAGLDGTLLWVPESAADLWLDAAGIPYRIKDIDVGKNHHVIGRVGAHTTVELFAPGVKSGVDMVILADVSDSMRIEDIPAHPEGGFLSGGRQSYLSRMEVLKQALRDLLDVRLNIAGRISRVALIAFNHEAVSRFPRGGGMAQLDADSSRDVVEQFREAIVLLRHGGGTHIGNALHAAADLIYQHGRPDNDRLVVLVSDGADWMPKGEQGTGEVTEATVEPVSLMSHLHRDMKIRLHAIGISTRELYLRRFNVDTPGYTPNHGLLTELVKVGGGDPATIGGFDVIVEYFSGVGSGVSHRVRGPLSRPPQASLDPQAREKLATAAKTSSVADAVGPAIESFGVASQRVKAVSLRVFPGPLFMSADLGRAFEYLRAEVTEENVARTLRSTLSVLARPNLAPDQQPARVKQWVSLVDGLRNLVSAQPADLGGLAMMCQATSTKPRDLVAAVLSRLTIALTEIADEADGLPDHVKGQPKSTVFDSANASTVDGGGRGKMTEPVSQGLVYKE